jgi:phosphate starvation-inducible PhoH-like protein
MLDPARVRQLPDRARLIEVTIPLRSHDEAILVLGPYDRFAKLLRQDLDIEIFTRRGNLRLKGEDEDVQEAKRRIEHLLGKSRKGRELQVGDIEAILLGGDASSSESLARGMQAASRVAGGRNPAAYRVLRPGLAGSERSPSGEDAGGAPAPRPRLVPSAAAARGLRVSPVEPRTENQRRYLELIEKCPLVFGLGIAGTGKTYLAVAAAVRALRSGECRRLVITRPVVEAGERLGFLPGDVQAKLNPYLRPIYDALYDLLDFEEVSRLEENGVIEVAPLAFMRGRTLSHAFAILDEGQNTTVPQMKMFLTRLGEGSRMVVTGDPTQTDLDDGRKNGLHDAASRLRGFMDIGIVEFGARDIVRHPLVEQIVKAYEAPARGAREGGKDTERSSP